MVPAGWRDQTMNVFRLPGANGKKDTSLLITRDPETQTDDVHQYADAQQEAAKRQFNGYKFLGKQDTTIDDEPAAIVDYLWRSNATALLRQRQAFVWHDGSMLVITLTAMLEEFDEHAAVWDEFLASIKLRRDQPAPMVEPAANDELPVPAPVLPAAGPQHLYALAVRQRTLHIVPPTVELQSAFNALDVEDGLWAFYAADGSPLRPHMVVPNRKGVFWSEPGKFELLPDERGNVAHLSSLLDGIRAVKGPVPWSDLGYVREQLQQASGAKA